MRPALFRPLCETGPCQAPSPRRQIETQVTRRDIAAAAHGRPCTVLLPLTELGRRKVFPPKRGQKYQDILFPASGGRGAPRRKAERGGFARPAGGENPAEWAAAGTKRAVTESQRARGESARAAMATQGALPVRAGPRSGPGGGGWGPAARFEC